MQKSVAWRRCDCVKRYYKNWAMKHLLLMLILLNNNMPSRVYQGIWWFGTSSWITEGSTSVWLTLMWRACPPLPYWLSKVRELVQQPASRFVLYLWEWMPQYMLLWNNKALNHPYMYSKRKMFDRARCEKSQRLPVNIQPNKAKWKWMLPQTALQSASFCVHHIAYVLLTHASTFTRTCDFRPSYCSFGSVCGLISSDLDWY